MLQDVEVRPVRAAEWRELRSLRLQALQDSPRSFGSTYERERSLPEEDWRRLAATAAAGEEAVAIVAVGAGRFVRMARGVVTGDPAEEESRTVWLLSVYVDPAWRGRGVGRAVCESITGWARERGAAGVLLRVGDWNAPARILYEGMGFTVTGRQDRLAWDASVVESEMHLVLAGEDDVVAGTERPSGRGCEGATA
ncbi:MAG: GNAT family N-acetyltransferase [Chloroflexi bacterium]|nr:GNAT family N-acetyltransferase [Chloroflexota bacterium]